MPQDEDNGAFLDDVFGQVEEEVDVGSTEAWLNQQWEKAKGLFERNKFEWGGLTKALKDGIETLKAVQDMSGAEKSALMVEFLCKIIDETDTKYVPDFASDPPMKAAVRAWGPSLITLICGDEV